MKKILFTCYLLLVACGLFAQNQWVLEKTRDDMRAYKQMFIADGGEMRDAPITAGYYAFCEQNGMADSIKFAFLSEGAIKDSTVGIYNYAQKLYDLGDFYNHGVQTTLASMPYIGGQISPTERYALKNPTGDTRSITFPDITVSGTYTITEVANYDTIGKITITQTEVISGTLNSLSVAGKLYAYIVRAGSYSTTQKLAEYSFLRSIYSEVESVQIGTQRWATSNFEAVATPMGNVIANMQAAGNVEKITNGGFDTDTDWKKGSGWTISDSIAICNKTDGSTELCQLSGVNEKWYKITFTIVDYVSGNCAARAGGNSGVNRTTTGTFTEYLYSNSTQLGVWNSGGFVGSIDNISVEEVGWSGSTDLYNGIYAQTSGDAATKTTAALRASAMWCYYNNDIPTGAIYGKLYNWYAVALLQEDITAYNAANPSAHWGWHVPSSTEFTTLQTYLGGASVAGGKMKVPGLDYWLTPNTGADNSSGFSALPNGLILDGNPAVINLYFTTWASDETGATTGIDYYITNNSPALNTGTTIPKNYGLAIRLISD